MDPSLQAAIQNSKVLTDELRSKLLQVSDKLSEEKAHKLLKLLSDAEAQHEQIVVDLETKKRSINEKYVAGVNDFLKHGYPKLMKKAEEEDKAEEETELEGILSQLDNA